MKLKPGKYLQSETNGHIFIFDESTAKLPQMRVLQITAEDAQAEDLVEVDLTPAVPVPEAELRREDLEALYLTKYGRKPHPKMRIERLKQMVESTDGNDPGPDDH